MVRRRFLSVLFVALAGFASIGHALEIKPFSADALSGLQSAGKPVAVHFHADWCPTCVNQAKSLDALKTDPQLQAVTVLVADYDKERDLKRALKVRSQSTFVVFKGQTEVARSGGQTRPEQIRQVLAKAL